MSPVGCPFAPLADLRYGLRAASAPGGGVTEFMDREEGRRAEGLLAPYPC